MSLVNDVATRRFFSRDTDHLGFLEKQLKDLAGFATLTHELLQNADDAAASWIEFRVERDALRVANDGRFSDCERQDEPDCPWLADPIIGKRCDFHRLRRVASGDKRRESETTGAFGVGFTAVYQVTDRPEVISAGRHWILDEVRDAAERIEECAGCATCRAPDLPATVFVLPWARDPSSDFRVRTRSTPLAAGDEAHLEEEIRSALPTALLFLRHVCAAELWSSGELQYRIDRLVDGDDVLMQDPSGTRLWHLLRGQFDDAAVALRAQLGPAIEDKRRASVTVAIPVGGDIDGVLCAYLPTQHRIGLPFHVNADFIPTSDRKRIQFEGDAARSWNAAALRAAAGAVAVALPRLRQQLAPVTLWRLINDALLARQAANRSGSEQQFGLFWDHLDPIVRNMRSVYTGDGRWLMPRDVAHFPAELDEVARRDLERLGIGMVHPDLRPFFNVLSTCGVVPLTRVRLLTALRAELPQAAVGTALEAASIEACGAEDAETSRWWQEPSALARMWAAIEQLPAASEKARAGEKALARTIPLVPCRDGTLECLEQCWVADEEAGQLLTRFAPDVPVSAPDLAYVTLLREYGDWLGVPQFIEQLEAERGELAQVYARDPGAFGDFLRWLADHRVELITKPDVVQRVSHLPIIPSGHTVRPLAELSLPGDFTDALGIAGIVDLESVGDVRDLLQALGATPLSVVAYVTDHVPAALARDDLNNDTRRAVVLLLAHKRGELLDQPRARRALSQSRIVECDDAAWRIPGDVYLRTEVVAAALGDRAMIARLPEQGAETVRELLLWLGVRDAPRAVDLVDAISTLSAQMPDADARSRIVRLTVALADAYENGELTTDLIVRLRGTPWLPTKRDRTRWHRPDRVYSTFREYLFATQAEFIELPQDLQQRGSKFLAALAIRDTPPPELIARHLLTCASAKQAVNQEVYPALQLAMRQPGGESALHLLRDQPVIQIQPGRFVTAREAVWSAHPFGARRVTLDATWRAHQPLLTALGVRESVDADDALDVLHTCTREFGPGNRTVPEADRAAIHSAWVLLGETLDKRGLATGVLEALRGSKVVVSAAGHLVPPTSVFFGDRADLVAKFAEFHDFFVARDAATWGALRAAGVRSLGTAVRTSVTLGGEIRDGDALLNRLRDRYTALLQAAAATLPPAAAGRDLEQLLAAMRCVAASEITLTHALDVGGRRFEKPPVSALAAWDRDHGVLAWTGPESGRMWAAIARELALALEPAGEHTGPLASGFNTTLAARSRAEAHDTLDGLGYARVHHRDPAWHGAPVEVTSAPVSSGAPTNEGSAFEPDVLGAPAPSNRAEGRADPLGGSAAGKPGAEVPQAARLTPPRASADAIHVGPSGEAPPSVSLLAPQMRARDTNEGALPGDEPRFDTHEAPPDVPHPSEDINGDDHRPFAGDASAPSEARISRPQQRYAATVYPQPIPLVGNVSAGGGGDPWAARLATDAAGVALVLDYERQCGRSPVEMPHGNPGYDVESRDQTGEILRYIEVKSTADSWGARGVAVSPTQLEVARTLHDRYWLYIVEQAGGAGARIRRIQDPYGHIEQFAFDDAWRPFAEEDAGVE